MVGIILYTLYTGSATENAWFLTKYNLKIIRLK